MSKQIPPSGGLSREMMRVLMPCPGQASARVGAHGGGIPGGDTRGEWPCGLLRCRRGSPSQLYAALVNRTFGGSPGWEPLVSKPEPQWRLYS